jgi:hypothetical protein
MVGKGRQGVCFPPTYFEDRSVRFQEVEMSVKANVCSGCVHRLVCAHKRDFSEAQKATGDIRISADETGCWVKVSDMKWIDVAINCLNFKKDCPAESCRGEREREKVR